MTSIEESFRITLAIEMAIASIATFLWFMLTISRRRTYFAYWFLPIMTAIYWTQLLRNDYAINHDALPLVWFTFLHGTMWPIIAVACFNLAWEIARCIKFSSPLPTSTTPLGRRIIFIIFMILMMALCSLMAWDKYAQSLRIIDAIQAGSQRAVVCRNNSTQAESQPTSQAAGRSTTQAGAQPKNENGGGEKK